MADQPQTADDVKSIVDDRDIRFIRFWFTDILGQLKSFSINKAELDDAFEGGMGFDGSSITGFNAIEESDMIAMPEATRGQGRRPDVLRRSHAEPRALRGRPAPRHAAGASARRGNGFRHLQRRPRARVLLFQEREA
jgi:glutamine synthetase